MDGTQTRERSENLGSALQRLSAARELRGPVGVFDPLEIVAVENRLAASEPLPAKRRRSIFRFSDRAQHAIDADA